MRHTNFREDIVGSDPEEAVVRMEVQRGHARRFLDREIKDYSQWFRGRENVVADALSRDDDRTDEELTNILHTFCAQQTPKHFKILPLPKEISSWLISLLQRLSVKEQLQERHTRTKLGRGSDGASIANPLALSTSTSTASAGGSESGSWEPSPWLCVKGDSQVTLMKPWLKAQSEVPFHMWHRPSARTTVQIQQKTKTANLADFYRGCTGASETTTRRQSRKRLCPPASCVKSPS